MKKVVFLLLVFSVIFTPLLWAKDAVDTLGQDAKSEVYGTKAGGMLGRGLLNAVTCFVDLIVHTVEGTQQGPPVVGTLTGLGSGIACTALRATSGVLDVATFWVPGFNGFPVSRSYSNCMEPEGEGLAARPQEIPQAPSQPAPVLTAVDYAKPAAPQRHDTYDYVKK